MRCPCSIASHLAVVVCAAAVGFLLFATRELPNRGAAGGCKLGDPVYDFAPVDAPAASGRLLRVLSWALTETPVGYFVRPVRKKKREGAVVSRCAAAPDASMPLLLAGFCPRDSPHE